MLIDFFRWARGYVRFEASGEHLERFIGLCLKEGLFLWGPRKKEHRLVCYMTAKDYLSIRPCAKESGASVRIREKGGLPFLLRRYKRRPGLPAGLCLALALLYLSTFFVWDIQFVGNGVVSTEELSAFLSEQGVKVGGFKPSFEVKEIQREAMLHFPQLSWIAVNLMGGTAQVEVRETVMPPKKIDHMRPQNLVAEKGGEILHVEAWDGTAMVQPGDQVLPGDLLVSGILEDPAGNVTLRQAIGKVTAKTKYDYEYTIPLFETKDLPSGKMEKRYSLKIYGLEFPLYFSSEPPFEKSLSESYLHEITFFSHFFGVSVREQVFYELTPQNVSHTSEEAKEIALVLLEEQINRELDGVNIKKRNLSARTDAFVYTLNAELICEENIAKSKEILIGD